MAQVIKSKKGFIFYFFAVSFLPLVEGPAAVDKEKSYAPVMRALMTPPTPSHQAKMEEWFEALAYPKGRIHSPTQQIPVELEGHIKQKLSQLYAENMRLISEFEPYADKTPHMDPEEWAAQQITEWKNEAPESFESNLDEGIGETLQTSYESFVIKAKEALLDLIKENELLTEELARRRPLKK